MNTDHLPILRYEVLSREKWVEIIFWLSLTTWKEVGESERKRKHFRFSWGSMLCTVYPITLWDGMSKYTQTYGFKSEVLGIKHHTSLFRESGSVAHKYEQLWVHWQSNFLSRNRYTIQFKTYFIGYTHWNWCSDYVPIAWNKPCFFPSNGKRGKWWCDKDFEFEGWNNGMSSNGKYGLSFLSCNNWPL